MEIFACKAATQERIIPIGTSENCLIGLEIISGRYGKGEFGEKTFWSYTISLKGYNNDYTNYLIAELDYNNEIENEKILNYLNEQFEKALKICIKLDDFEILKAREIKLCEYQSKCSKIELVTTKKEIKIKTKDDKLHNIHFLNSNYNGIIAKPYREYYENYYKSEIIGFDLKISSIRIYENSIFNLLIFHLGTGQEFKSALTDEYPEKTEYKYQKELIDFKDAIFIEPVLHHGKGFDYFILNEN